MRFEVGNIFNSAPKVHDALGDSCRSVTSRDLLDPLGRTIMISFRKQFLPTSFYQPATAEFRDNAVAATASAAAEAFANSLKLCFSARQ